MGQFNNELLKVLEGHNRALDVIADTLADLKERVVKLEQHTRDDGYYELQKEEA